MQDLKAKSLGMDFTIQVPSSVEEFDQLAGREGATLDEAINNVLYRSFHAEFRPTFLHGSEELGIEGIEKQTGIERRTKVVTPAKTDEAGKVTEDEVIAYDESEANYFKRVCAEKGVESTHFQPYAQEVASLLKFDPKKAPRQSSGPKKVAKQYLDAAAQIEKEGRLETSAANLQSKLSTPESTWVVEATVESVARAISEDQRRKRAQQNIASEY